MRNSKGASTVMEQVLILLFGVLVLITVVVTFSQLKDDSVSYSAGPQFQAVAQQVNAVLASAQEHMQLAGYGYIGFEIPPKIAGKSYIVVINSTHIRVEDFQQEINRTALLVSGNITITGNISSENSGKGRVYFNATSRTIEFTTV